MSIMKHLIICLMAVALSATIAAQSKTISTGGLYLTSQDFETHHLTYEYTGDDAQNKLVLRNFFGSSKGFVISNGQKHVFDKNQVYGYRDSQGKIYRFYQGEPYLLVDTVSF